MGYCENCGNWDNKLSRGLCVDCFEGGKSGNNQIRSPNEYIDDRRDLQELPLPSDHSKDTEKKKEKIDD